MDENNDGYVTVGETIQYEFNITNTGNVALTNITLSDNNAYVNGGPIEILVVGASDTTTFSAIHTITEDDLIDGEVLNQATIIAEDPNGNMISDISDDPFDPVNIDADGDGDPDDPTLIGLPIKDPISSNDIEDALTGESTTIDIVANDEQGTFGLDPLTVTLSVPVNAIDIITDTDGDVVGFVIPGEGTWSVNEITGAVTFTPEDNYIGDPTKVEYTIEDTQGNSASASIIINYPPVAYDDKNISLPMGEVAVLVPWINDKNTSTALDPTRVSLIPPSEAIDILVDTDGDVISFVMPEEGKWTVDEETGTVTFDPNSNLTGDPTSVNYTIQELDGDVSNEAILVISYIRGDYAESSSISGLVWNDSNSNGILDDGEEAIDDLIMVELLDEDGNAMPCSYTDRITKEKVTDIESQEHCIVETVNGEYSFDVLPGTYQVCFTMPEDMIQDEYRFSEVDTDNVVIQENTFTYTSIEVLENENRDNINAPIMCPCALIKGDSASALNRWSFSGLILLVILLGSYMIFREEELYSKK